MSETNYGSLPTSERRRTDNANLGLVFLPIAAMASLLVFISFRNKQQEIGRRAQLQTKFPTGVDHCARHNKNSLYPFFGEESISNCELHSGYDWCDTCARSEVCTKSCSDARLLCTHEPSAAFQHMNLCLWKLVAHLPEVCADTFGTAPPTFTNPDPSKYITNSAFPDPICTHHGMCQACMAATGDDEDSNKYCHAVTSYYSYSGLTVHNFFIDLQSDTDHESFWCQEQVLQAIDDGSFASLFPPPSSAALLAQGKSTDHPGQER